MTVSENNSNSKKGGECMPLNVKSFWASCLLVLLLAVAVSAQTDEAMRQKMARARAFIATKNYNAAVYELDGIRRDTKDESVQSVALTMLMNVYLEQGDYRRAQDLLIETYNGQKTTKKVSQTYYSVASQVVRGSKAQVERYKSFGLSIKDQSLPTEATAEIEKMRETLEMIVKQSEELSDAKKQSDDSISLLEEASTARSVMARDDFDASRWKNKIVDVREKMATSRATVVNVVEDVKPKETVAVVVSTPTPAPVAIVPISDTKTDKKKKDLSKNMKGVSSEPSRSPIKPKDQPVIPPVIPNNQNNQTVAVVEKPSAVIEKVIDKPPVVEKPVEKPPVTVEKKAEPTVVAVEKPIEKPPVVPEKTPEVKRDPFFNASPVSTGGNETTVSTIEKPVTETNDTPPVAPTEKPKTLPTPETTATVSNDPVQIGSLKEYATRIVQPSYPAIAKSMRMTGTVKIDFTVDEKGDVSTIQSSSGPDMLKRAALDALKKWKFKPFEKDGQPAKAIGFVSFNFAL
jgi:periplasmic protein TonB